MKRDEEFRSFEPDAQIKGLIESRIKRLEAKIQAFPSDSTFFGLVSPHLEWLDHFINHLIRYSEAMDELVRDQLNAEEVVDESVIRGYREFLRNPSIGDVRSWLARIAVDRLDGEISRLEVSEPPPQEEVWQLGEEIFYFYQPDEDLEAEDVIPAPTVSTPEDELAAREIREYVGDALRAIPEEWRRILVMRYSDEQPVPNIARSLRRSEREVRRILSYSSKYVRQRLIESGCILVDRRRAA